MTPDHVETIRKLKEIGKHYGFHASDKTIGSKYHLATIDVLWCIDCTGKKGLTKILSGERCKCPKCKSIKAVFMPVVAFEVACSEKEKALRGSVMSLQLANASAGILVLAGEAQERKAYVRKLLARYSFGRLRLWTKRDVDRLYDSIQTNETTPASIIP
jgi:hypothetical protein